MVCAAVSGSSNQAQRAAQPQPAAAADLLARQPLAFEANQGQADPSVQYLAHQGAATTYFTAAGTTTVAGGHAVTVSLAGAAPMAFGGDGTLAATTNYFLGSDPSGWQQGISNFGSIQANDVYPGINVRYYGNGQRALEHDFLVAPRADPNQLILALSGQQSLARGDNGSVRINLGDAALALEAPVSYQDTDGRRTPVESWYVLDGSTVRISLGSYDRTKPLVIDPTLTFQFSTLLGGSGDESVYNIATDSSDNTYVSGYTTSSDFPTQNEFQGSLNGTQNAYVAKFDANGSLVYSTYLGGSGTEVPANQGLAVDSSGNAYVTGSTDSGDFPLQDAYQGGNNGGATNNDAFVTKLSFDGSSLIYSTYLGGSDDDMINGSGGIAVDASDQAYVTGYTESSDLPASGGAYQSFYNGSTDAFIAKFSTDGQSLDYLTYLGGGGFDQTSDIAVDASGNAYVSGTTGSGDFPTNGAAQLSSGGGIDVFITKLDPAGSNAVYSTYLGGSSLDFNRSLALDQAGNVFVTGTTFSSDFPTFSPFQAALAGFNDVYVTKLNPSGSAFTYSTYFGGSAVDSALAIDVDATDNAYVTGYTTSTDLPTQAAFQQTNGGGEDAFVLKLNPGGTGMVYSTYVGGTGNDGGGDIVVDQNGHAHIGGGGDSSNFPTVGAYQSTNNGGVDGFVIKTDNNGNLIVSVASILTFALSSTTCDLGHFSLTQTKFCTFTIDAATNAGNGYAISYAATTTLTSGANTITAMGTQTGSVLGSEQFGFNLKANTAAGSNTASDFGADPSGGLGAAVSGYDIAEQFKFDTAGDTVAEALSATDDTTYTASFIANVEPASVPGTYSTPMKFTIVPSY